MLTKLRSIFTRLALAASLVAGCARVTSPPAGADHPASASAPETPRPAPSRALVGDLGELPSATAASGIDAERGGSKAAGRTHDMHVHGGE
jgi:hypothetical protein